MQPKIFFIKFWDFFLHKLKQVLPVHIYTHLISYNTCYIFLTTKVMHFYYRQNLKL